MKKSMFFLFSVSYLFALFSCQTSKEENKIVGDIKLLVVDSLQVDHLGKLNMIDLKEDHSEFLLYDGLSHDFLRVDRSGNILQQINRTGDGKDNYQSKYFMTAQYLENGDILIETYGMQFIYNGNFELKEKRQTPFSPIIGRMLGSTVNLPIGESMFSFTFHTGDSRDEFSESHAVDYPVLTSYKIDDFSVIARGKFPRESQMVLNPGTYNFDNPLAVYHNDELFLNFISSPEIYVYEFPGLVLKRVINLQPGENYKQNAPGDGKENFERFFNILSSSTFGGFNFSNDYLITWYNGAAPKDEVDALPRNVVGGPEFLALAKKYDKTYYQVFDGDKKLWEGQKDLKLSSCRNLIFNKLKEGETEDEVEKDSETFYFYEVNID